jgi:hypothetical protein
MPLTLLPTLTSEGALEEAYAWLCRQRKRWPDSADIWDFRRQWPFEKATLQRELRSGTYQIGLLSRTTLANGEEVDLWAARDALVMKALTLVLQPVLPLSSCCTHLKGQGGDPHWLVTDKLRSYDAAHRSIMPTVRHINHVYANNRAEVSHQPTRQQEYHMRGFASSTQAQRFLTLHGLTQNRAQAFQVWKEVVCA